MFYNDWGLVRAETNLFDCNVFITIIKINDAVNIGNITNFYS